MFFIKLIHQQDLSIKQQYLNQFLSNQKFNTAKVNAVSTVGGKRETAVKPLAGCNWRPQRYHGGSKYNSGFSLGKYYPHRYLDEFQDFNGGPVAFGGSKGHITGK
ncbi:hypothetical protein Tco_0402601, partial [Tanacetum coccineum]